ncbi:hypothetical protein [Jiulongibacter sediminis]|jgi:hypothetical protein|uniref:hypothetical protein n=1 Tax=Jiulongibacter sediminis TaxID=1605367 RepID=UPI0026EC4612|nr:hypothetical protein [Jiulongibacter sediminis]
MRLFIAVLIFALVKCDSGVDPANARRAINEESFKDLLLSGRWQIDQGFINDYQVIDAGASLNSLVDFEVSDQISWIEFKKDNSVEMRFDAADTTLSMQYEVNSDVTEMKIFPARGVQDLLLKEKWVLSEISIENQQFEMQFSETSSGSTVVTRLILKRI